MKAPCDRTMLDIGWIARGAVDLLRDMSGAVALEYGLIAAIISIGLILFLPGVRTGLSGMFGRIATCLSSQGGAC